MSHFLQSKIWGEFQEKLGKKVFLRRGKTWNFLAILEKSKFGISRLYLPYGPQISREEDFSEVLAELKKIAKKYKVDFLRVEPLGISIDEKFQRKFHLKTVKYSQPEKTWVIDLSPDLTDLVASMKRTKRAVFRNYHKKNLRYRESENPAEISELIRLLRGVEKHNRVIFHSDKYFKIQAETLLKNKAGKLHFIELLTEENSPKNSKNSVQNSGENCAKKCEKKSKNSPKIIAGALTFSDEKTVYYAHAGADYEHRKLQANTALVAEIMVHAKKAGKSEFDLYGISSSESSTDAWSGFTSFKKSFGGEEKYLSKTYDIPLTKRYFCYYYAKKFWEKLRKIK